MSVSSQQLLSCRSSDEYTAAVRAYLDTAGGPAPVLASDATWSPGSVARSSGEGHDDSRIVARSSVEGHANSTSVVIATPSTWPFAELLAAATGRRWKVTTDAAPLTDLASESSFIFVAEPSRCTDDLLLQRLDDLAAALDVGAPWEHLPRFAIVTGRDYRALSWLVAKLVTRTRRPTPEQPRVRHFHPAVEDSQLLTVGVVPSSNRVTRMRLGSGDLVAAYAEKIDVVAFRTHGSEACAKGGGGTVLCGRHEQEHIPPEDPGVLACGRGYRCPRGPSPVPLAKMGAEVMLLASCNGLRLANSLTHSDFNFALSFVDGEGLGFVSTVFTSIGGDFASLAFLAAMSSGLSLGDSTLLINALVHQAHLERPCYLLLGDPDYQLGAQRARVLKVASLPASLALVEQHHAEIVVTDPPAVSSALAGKLSLAITGENALPSSSASVFGFHRIERRPTGTCVVLHLFSYPRPIGAIEIAPIDRAELAATARATIARLDRWIRTYTLFAIDASEPELFGELQTAVTEVIESIDRALALSTLHGTWSQTLARYLRHADSICVAASLTVLEYLAPRLIGAFWLSNTHTTNRLRRSTAGRCPSCSGPALQRTLDNELRQELREVLVCPRCGICSDIPDTSPVSAIAIEVPELVPAGTSMQVRVRLKLSCAAHVAIALRLSTHGEPTTDPEPSIAASYAEAGDVAFSFVVPVDATLSPHRHYVKLLLATPEGLAFACRPFFVRRPQEEGRAALKPATDAPAE